MFDSAKTFLLRCSDEFTIDKQAGGGIAMVSVKAEDFHPRDQKSEVTAQEKGGS
jgi:hypothetical protein